MDATEILPNAPETVLVDTVSDKSLKISWRHSGRDYRVTHYYVNITALVSFDALNNGKDESDKAIDKDQPFSMQIKIPADQNSTIVDNLNSFTMYEITVSFNQETLTTSRNDIDNPFPAAVDATGHILQQSRK